MGAAELLAISSPQPLPGAIAKHQAALAAVEAEIEAMFNPEELPADAEIGDFDDPTFETMREVQDGQMVELEARREAIRGDLLLAILDQGPLPHAFATRAQRRAMQAGVDALIDYLDAVTPDADLEDGDDLEGVDEDGDLLDDGEKDLCDHEPSLGAPEVHMLFRWGSGGIVDRKCDQTRWADGDGDDLELGDDNGIADMDGLCEQVQAYDGRLLWSNGGYVA